MKRWLTELLREIRWTIRAMLCRRRRASNATGSIGARSRLVQNLEAGKPQRVVAYGTSLTAGGTWVADLQQALDRLYPGRAIVFNRGEGGQWSGWGLANLDRRVMRCKPDALFIEFAINDAHVEFKISPADARRNLEQMIDRVRATNPDCEVILMVMNPPTGEFLENRPHFKTYDQAYRDVAKDRRLMLIDHSTHWEKILAESPELFRKYVPDGIHPNALGCTHVITPAVLNALGIGTDSR